jgi:glycerol-3-phosphate acyltransferase PlsY
MHDMPPPDAGYLQLAGWGVAVLVVAAGYLLGCTVSGYCLVHWRRGRDIRNEGSGSAGGTNIPRVLGKAGFVPTFLLDLAKGALFPGWASTGRRDHGET